MVWDAISIFENILLEGVSFGFWQKNINILLIAIFQNPLYTIGIVDFFIP